MIQMMQINGYFVRDAAVYLGLRPGTVRRYASRGLLKPCRRVGNMLLFSRSELDRFRSVPRKKGNPLFRKSNRG